jgi:hypothetical protein
MLNKFSKVNKSNKQEMNEFHPDFDPCLLPLAEQFKYWAKKNAQKRAQMEKDNENKVVTQPKISITHRK